MLVLGVDEAGRGPLIGDMFVAAVAIPNDQLDVLADIGVRDSKKLSPTARKKLFNAVISYSKYVFVRRFPPDVIDVSNISSLFIDAIKSSIRTAYTLGLNPSEIYVDSTSNTQKIINSISELLHDDVKLVVEYKADEKYVVVAAASIVAKVLRDAYIEYLKATYGDFGSGYPSDPRTIRWVEEVLTSGSSLPPIVRRSWKTIKRLGRKHRTLEDYIK